MSATALPRPLNCLFEGSRDFTRYRTIDIDMKKAYVKILEGVK